MTGQTSGCAGGAGHAPHLGLVGVFIYVCHGGVGVIFGRGAEKTNVGSSLWVWLHLLSREEGTNGLADLVSTKNTQKKGSQQGYDNGTKQSLCPSMTKELPSTSMVLRICQGWCHT